MGEQGPQNKHKICFYALGGEHSPVRRADRLGKGPFLSHKGREYIVLGGWGFCERVNRLKGLEGER